MNSIIYYLQWQQTDYCVDSRAIDLFHEFHLDPPPVLKETLFDELYEEVVETQTNDFEQLYAEWNRGSGQESQEFQELR